MYNAGQHRVSMKGATADPSVSTIKVQRNKCTITIGNSHHFFRSLIKAHNSINKSRIVELTPVRTDSSCAIEPVAPACSGRSLPPSHGQAAGVLSRQAPCDPAGWSGRNRSRPS